MRDIEQLRTGRPAGPGSRRARLAATGVCTVLGLLLAACSSSAPPASKNKQQSRTNTVSQDARAAQVSITPRNGRSRVKPDKGVSVTVIHGKLQTVTVSSGHSSAPGTITKNGTAWQSLWPLRTGARYKVTATAVGLNGKTVTTTSTFKTLHPAATFSASTLLGNQSYGVGMPIMINFSQPVDPKYQAGIERAIEIKSSKPVVGAWYWDGNQVLDFRTRQYWPQHTDVRFIAHLNGAEAAPGVYGAANLSQSFSIGKSLISVTSTRTHRTRVWWGQKEYTWTASTGAPGDDTANGTYLTIEKANPTLMSGPGYKNLPVAWSVRFTWSGNYYHSAPWSVGDQGSTNVSHGCVNLSPQHAEWYYTRASPGDPITITGSPVAGKWDDGWTLWFLTWPQLLRGSATKEAVQVGPNGSTFVSPGTLPATVPDSALSGSKPQNSLAG